VYVPSAFAFEEKEHQYDFIDRFGFATVVAHGETGLEASHLPLMLDRERGVLFGHMARMNPMVAHIDAGSEVLAIFHGPHAYISPVWYHSDAMVPTWNYSVVHVSGRLRRHNEPAEMVDSLHRLIRHFDRDAEQALVKSNRMLPGLLNGIVGFELPITQITGKHKLGQNRAAADRVGLFMGLSQAAEPEGRALAAWMTELGLVESKEPV